MHSKIGRILRPSGKNRSLIFTITEPQGVHLFLERAKVVWMVSNPQRSPADTCTRPTLLLESRQASSGTGESGESDVNTTDWWRTVKLPFVKEKQEASCGRPSLSGWEETAGRKPRLQSSGKKKWLSCGVEGNSCPSVSIVLAFWPRRGPSSFLYHSFHTKLS